MLSRNTILKAESYKNTQWIQDVRWWFKSILLGGALPSSTPFVTKMVAWFLTSEFLCVFPWLLTSTLVSVFHSATSTESLPKKKLQSASSFLRWFLDVRKVCILVWHLVGLKCSIHFAWTMYKVLYILYFRQKSVSKMTSHYILLLLIFISHASWIPGYLPNKS